MIYLGGASTISNGIMVLPDYSDPRQFYYLPPPPRLAVEPVSGRKVFKLIKLAGGLTDPTAEEIRTGIVFFDCDLSLTSEELEQLEDHVRQTFHPGPGAINLSPLFYKEGEVSCYVLGEQDWPDNAPPERKNLFVERLQGFGKPSLYGDNRASFSARMTQEGATTLEASLMAGGPIGISIVYTLKFDALQPAFKFKVEAKWDQIYHYLEEKFGVDLFFVNVESTNIVEELEHQQLLRFEEVVYDPSASGDVQQLRKQMQQYVLEQFFTPVLSAGDPKHNKIPGMIHDVARALVVVPSFGYQRRELTQTERRSLSFEASRINAIERVIYPQANLFTLIPENEIQEYTLEVNTDADLFYRQLEVECVPGGFDFAKSKIAWVHPRIRYGNPPEEGIDKTFTSMADKMHFKTWLQEGHGFRYRYDYEVEFVTPDEGDVEAIYGRDLRMASPEATRTDRVLPINPNELYQIRSVEFMLKQGFPADRYPMVQVQAQYEETTGYQAARTYVLSSEPAKCKFRVRQARGVEGIIRYRLIYHRALGGKEFPFEWQIANESIVIIDDPFPSNLLVQVYIAELPTDIAWADVSLRYQDPTRPGNFQEARLFFEDKAMAAKPWTIHTQDPLRRRYQYRYTLFFKDNTVFEAPAWIDSEAPTLTIGRTVPMQRTIQIEAQGRSFETENLREINVSLRPDGSDPALPAGEVSLTKVGQRQEFTYRATNLSQIGYSYQILYRWRNGAIKTVQGHSPAGALDLWIPTKPA